MRVAVSQPAYLPWLGYFALLDEVDVFCLLDTVAVARQSWQTRNRVRLPDGRLTWLSLPAHGHIGQPLHLVELDYSRGWQRKHWTTLAQAYSKQPGWRRVKRYEPLFQDTYRPALLADFTCGLITAMAADLGIDTKIVRASQLEPTRDGKTERLEDLLGQLGATTYVTTRGATYLQGETHIGSVPIEWFDYVPQRYEQGGQEWCSHLSIIDVLAHSADPLAVIRAGVQSVQASTL